MKRLMLRGVTAVVTALILGVSVSVLLEAQPPNLTSATFRTITLTQVTAPTVTTNKLYNVGGTLTWNGAAITGVSFPITAPNAGALRTGTTAGDTLLLQAYDTDTGPAYTTLLTLTAGTTPTIVISGTGIGAGTAALEATSVTAIRLIHRDTGNPPDPTAPVWLEINGKLYGVDAATTVDITSGLDTGAEAAGTNYYVWATADTGVVTLKLSASKTAPTGLTTKRLLGSVHNSPTSDLISNSVASLAKGERNKEGMVQVGSIWVDIYEMSVWNAGTFGTGTQLGASSDDYACIDTGNDCATQYAQSRYGVIPSRYMSWFQASRFCANSGKRLITDPEWQLQALGTPEVVTKTVSALTSVTTTATATITTHGYGAAGATKAVIINGATQTEYNGNYTVTVVDANTVTYTFAGSVTSPATGSPTAQLQTNCIVNAPGPRVTGLASSCKSWANTYDNVGNLWEWTNTWFGGTPVQDLGVTIGGAATTLTEPQSIAGWAPGLVDYLYNVRGNAYSDGAGSGYKNGLFSAPLRGGFWSDGTNAGVFTVSLFSSPWYITNYIGGRCAGQ
jgi:hypothetical protein